MELVALDRGRRGAAAATLAGAFLDDPAWLAIGPGPRGLRRRFLRAYYGMALAEALRYGGPSWCALRGESVAGAAVTFAAGERYPPRAATFFEGLPFLLAGPGPALRGARVDEVMRRAHPDDPHVYLWFLAAGPAFQRQGVGRALLERVLAEAHEREVPVYLETTREENVPYYASFGFEVAGQASLPRGARMWFMRREVRSPGGLR